MTTDRCASTLLEPTHFLSLFCVTTSEYSVLSIVFPMWRCIAVFSGKIRVAVSKAGRKAHLASLPQGWWGAPPATPKHQPPASLPACPPACCPTPPTPAPPAPRSCTWWHRAGSCHTASVPCRAPAQQSRRSARGGPRCHRARSPGEGSAAAPPPAPCSTPTPRPSCSTARCRAAPAAAPHMPPCFRPWPPSQPPPAPLLWSAGLWARRLRRRTGPPPCPPAGSPAGRGCRRVRWV